MAAAGPAQNQTVEEILASIRQAITENGAKRRESRLASPSARQETSTVRRLVPVDDSATGGSKSMPDAGTPQSQDVIDHAIEKALDGVRAELEGADETNADEAHGAGAGGDAPEPVRARVAAGPGQRGADDPRQRALLSSRAGAAVSASFDDLARSMITNTPRLEALVEGMLRPMLRGWLDDNLPLLVERLVREEIERVSRGRR